MTSNHPVTVQPDVKPRLLTRRAVRAFEGRSALALVEWSLVQVDDAVTTATVDVLAEVLH